LGFLRLRVGQCIGVGDGCAEQRKSFAQSISRYVLAKVVHHDSTVKERKRVCGNGICVDVRGSVATIAPLDRQLMMSYSV
jgi:hypothetical protein